MKAQVADTTGESVRESAAGPARNAAAAQAVLDVMARLRDPKAGCPWDIEQNFASIAPYTIEEAYEVADAIAREDMPALKEELGDLLFQVAFHARMERHLEQEVAKLLFQRRHIFARDRVGDFVGFLDGVGGDAGEVLLDVPRAAGFGVAQPRHDVEHGLGGGGVASGACGALPDAFSCCISHLSLHHKLA